MGKTYFLLPISHFVSSRGRRVSGVGAPQQGDRWVGSADSTRPTNPLVPRHSHPASFLLSFHSEQTITLFPGTIRGSFIMDLEGQRESENVENRGSWSRTGLAIGRGNNPSVLPGRTLYVAFAGEAGALCHSGHPTPTRRAR